MQLLKTLAVLLSVTPFAAGQTPIGGNVYDGAGGPLAGGVTYYTTTHVIVPTGQTLTIHPGAIIKVDAVQWFFVNGTLKSNGTAVNPVIFTSKRDDTVGGDTNLDGNATVPAAGDWIAMQFNDFSDASVLSHTVVRYAGWGGGNALQLQQSNMSLNDCAVSDVQAGGLSLASSSWPTVTRCSFARCGSQPAVSRVTIDAVPAFTDNVAFENPSGNHIRVDQTFAGFPYVTVVGHLTINENNCMGGALVVANSITVPVNSSLTLGPGVVVKPNYTHSAVIDGALQVQGTAERPVVFTSYYDDSIGGDTNGDGAATAPAVGNWGGFVFNPGAATSSVRNAVLRYTGYGSAAVSCSSPNVTLDGIRAEFGAGGFDLTNVALAQHLVAAFGSTNGFRLLGNAFPLKRVTSFGNAGAGIVKAGVWTGTVASAIAVNNLGGDFVTLPAGTVNYSNGGGIAGGTGNTNVDPLFVNSGAGDFRLQSTSPCVDAGDPADLALGLDPTGNPTPLDGDLVGTRRVDMGAHEFDQVNVKLWGNPTPGGSLNIDVTGMPGLQTILVLGISPATISLPPYGLLLVDTSIALISPWPSAPSSINFAIPPSLPTPLPIIAQAIAVNATGKAGNTSNASNVVIE